MSVRQAVKFSRNGKSTVELEPYKDVVDFEFHCDGKPTLRLRITGGGQVHWQAPDATDSKYLEAYLLAPEFLKLGSRASGDPLPQMP